MKQLLIIFLFTISFITTAKEMPYDLFASSPVQTITFGHSVEERPLIDIQIGNGSKHLFLVGGIHGGYEWNTVTLSYQLLDYFKANPYIIPKNITLHIIPCLNPDGLFLITGKEGRFSASKAAQTQNYYLRQGGIKKYHGRFNANGVDLNRNWGYNWASTAYLGGHKVGAGDAPFSEPESIHLRPLIMNTNAVGVIFYHSAWNEIFASGAGAKDPKSIELGSIYSQASTYHLTEYFTAYPLNGDAGDWLSLQGIPSITVELKDHFDSEFTKNNAGALALLLSLAKRDL